MARLSFEGPPDIESEIFLRIDWLMARLSFEGLLVWGFRFFRIELLKARLRFECPLGTGFEIFLKNRLVNVPTEF